jgi:hypothetical protein
MILTGACGVAQIDLPRRPHAASPNLQAYANQLSSSFGIDTYLGKPRMDFERRKSASFTISHASSGFQGHLATSKMPPGQNSPDQIPEQPLDPSTDIPSFDNPYANHVEASFS